MTILIMKNNKNKIEHYELLGSIFNSYRKERNSIFLKLEIME